MIPFLYDTNDFRVGEYILIKGVKEGILNGETSFRAEVLGDNARKITLRLDPLTPAEKEIIVKGCLINYYKK